jgi:hypothetical protein
MAQETDCLLRLQMVRALALRELSADERTTLEGFLPKETSTAVREGIRALLARPAGDR